MRGGRSCMLKLIQINRLETRHMSDVLLEKFPTTPRFMTLFASDWPWVRPRVMLVRGASNLPIPLFISLRWPLLHLSGIHALIFQMALLRGGGTLVMTTRAPCSRGKSEQEMP
jgi:hypothetical protein